MAAGVVALVLVGSAAVAEPTIAITSPSDGTSFSRAFYDTIPVSGTVAFDAPAPALRRFLFRRDACGGTEPQNTHLSTREGADTGGCGNLVPVLASTTQYPAVDGLPLKLDTSKRAVVEVVTSNFEGAVGAGNQQVGVTLSGRTLDGALRTIGTGSQTQVILPGTGETGYRFEIVLPAGLADETFTSLNAALQVSGGALSGFVTYSGSSFIDLPIFDIGAVEVSADSATFSPSRTVQAEVGTDGTWFAEVPLPANGSRRIYARATQGTSRINATPVTITVTS